MKNVNALYALGLLYNIVVVTTSIAYFHVWKGKSEMSGSHSNNAKSIIEKDTLRALVNRVQIW